MPLAVGILAALAVIFWPKVETGGGGEIDPDTPTVVVEETVDVVDSATVAPTPQPEKVEPVKEEEAAPAPSLLYVTTSPSGATVYVDGKRIGTTPIEGKEVAQGRHTVKISKSGYESFSEKKQFGDKPVVLNETLVAEVKEAPSALPAASQQTSSRSATTGTINGRTYVDLGLSVKWADRNVGASSPSDYGSYFAWGETSEKSEYTEENSETHKKDFSDIAGSYSYDAASANWGGSWRLPTKAEFEELVNECDWTWTTNGYKVTGPNGNSIFLPATGYHRWTSIDSAGKRGDYWSSTPHNSTSLAYHLLFFEGRHNVAWYHRFSGRSVRPVTN